MRFNTYTYRVLYIYTIASNDDQDEKNIYICITCIYIIIFIYLKYRQLKISKLDFLCTLLKFKCYHILSLLCIQHSSRGHHTLF